MAKSKKRGRPKSTARKANSYKKWMEANGFSVNEIADEWEISRSYVYGLMNGSQTPSRKLALSIKEWTDGAVTVDSW